MKLCGPIRDVGNGGFIDFERRVFGIVYGGLWPRMNAMNVEIELFFETPQT
jgi:hypothetical protein